MLPPTVLTCSTRTLHALYAHLTFYPPATLEICPAFASALLRHLSARLTAIAREERRPAPTFKDKLWLPHPLRQWLPGDTLNRLLHHPSLVATAPAGLPAVPAIHWTKGLPSYVIFSNTARTARQMTAASFAALQAAPCPCTDHPEMCPEGSAHVMTTDPSPAVMSPRLRWFWNAGARYRPHRPSPPLDAVLDAADAAALRYARTRETDAHLPPGALSDWACTFVQLLRHHFAHAPTPQGFRWPIFSDADAAELRRLQRTYIISVTDKSASTFQLICPKYYAATVLADLTSNPQYYQPLTPAERAAGLAAATAAVAHLGLTYSAGLPDAYYSDTIKMHKTPRSMRFLSCSHHCPSTPNGQLAVKIFALLAESFAALWRATLPAGFEPWFCLNSQAVVDMVHAYNAAQVDADAADFTLPQMHDFTRLYTNLPHQLLRDTLAQVAAACFQHERARSIKVVTTAASPGSDDQTPTHTATWCDRAAPGQRVQTTADRTTRYFSPADLAAFVGTILDTAYVHFGEHLVRQICGIPMGIPPAPFIANLFLAWYEYQFLRQLDGAGAAATAILERFRYTKRFLDDLASLNNPFLVQFLPHGFQHDVGLHGIYPSQLDIPAQQHPHLPEGHSPFLDVLLVHEPATVGGRRISRFTTRLYDKRDQPAFAAVRLSRFVPASSNVNEAAKRNIFTSQFQRLRLIILDVGNFVTEVARVVLALAGNDYPLHRLLRASAELCALHPTAYWLHRRAPNVPLSQRIRDAVRRLRQDA